MRSKSKPRPRSAEIVRFCDFAAPWTAPAPRTEPALVIVLPVIRIERYDLTPARRDPQRRRLARHLKDIEDE